jgi:nucleotide-binding universal stress UspA family protein
VADPTPHRQRFHSEIRHFQFVTAFTLQALSITGFPPVSVVVARVALGELIALPVCVEHVLTVSPMAESNIRFNRILCAVTFSPSSRHVVAWAASLAGPYDGEVRLLHILPGSNDGTLVSEEVEPERVLTKLFALAQRLRERPRISAAVTEGDVAAEILRHARLVNADLIAVGMRARDESVSPLIARLAIHAPCPVLVVDERSTAPIKRGAVDHILVAVNFLPASLAAAEYAFALARTARAQVSVVHVLREHWDGPERRDPNVDEARRRVEHHFRQWLQLVVTGASGVNRDLSELVTSGRPCAEIVRIATSRDADLIVMGLDAGPESPHEFGETASCVMQFAGRTVLLVPERLFRAPRGSRRDQANRPH